MALAQLETEKWCPRDATYRQCQNRDFAGRCPDACYFFAQVNEEDMHGIEDMVNKMALAQVKEEDVHGIDDQKTPQGLAQTSGRK